MKIKKRMKENLDVIFFVIYVVLGICFKWITTKNMKATFVFPTASFFLLIALISLIYEFKTNKLSSKRFINSYEQAIRVMTILPILFDLHYDELKLKKTFDNNADLIIYILLLFIILVLQVLDTRKDVEKYDSYKGRLKVLTIFNILTLVYYVIKLIILTK
ncbi:hypothetical protein LJC13_01255 [Peptostreptococcaceae bacterium OttesenSCG-928-C18]|nr:hypothetical protein [Peptostreptococcaceae bacterium OttesenSCG-928-C18]